jgi:hypothetical protein
MKNLVSLAGILNRLSSARYFALHDTSVVSMSKSVVCSFL